MTGSNLTAGISLGMLFGHPSELSKGLRLEVYAKIGGLVEVQGFAHPYIFEWLNICKLYSGEFGILVFPCL